MAENEHGTVRMDMTLTASSYLDAGLGAIPMTGGKRPAVGWGKYMKNRMDRKEAEIRFKSCGGIGIVAGKVSGNLEVLDFDDKGSAFPAWFAKVPQEIRERLVVERTPSGGKHVYIRVEDDLVAGNRKLAMKADGKVLIETRGEGGCVKCAPSAGYVLERKDFFHIPVLSPMDEMLLVNLAKEMDESGGREESAPARDACVADAPVPVSAAGTTPWGDYNARGDIAALLERHGWKRTQKGENEHWERPGKDENSTSATWNGKVFYVFSSNAAPFAPEKGYGKFQVYAMLECGGDTREAARRLRREGYGCTALAPLSAACEPSASACVATGEEDGCAAADSAGIHRDPGPVPAELLVVPGFIGRYMDHILSTAPYPNLPLAFAASITMLSHLTGRRYRDCRDIRTNLYMVALADSGTGKDAPRKANKRLGHAIGIPKTIATKFVSAEGLEDALMRRPASFFEVDEMDTLLQSLQQKDPAMERILGTVLEMYTSSDAPYTPRTKALQARGKGVSELDVARSHDIMYPHLVILGTAIPEFFYKSLTKRMMSNGLVSRCLVIEAYERGDMCNAKIAPIPDDIMETAAWLVENGSFGGVDLAHPEIPPQDPELVTVRETDLVSGAFMKMSAGANARMKAAQEQSEKTLWSRAAEKAMKLALLRAISANPRDPLLTPEDVRWGWRLVDHLTRQTIYRASLFVSNGFFDYDRKQFLRLLAETGGRMSHSTMLRRTGFKAAALREIAETLVESDLISIEYGKNRKTIYKLCARGGAGEK
ncbi:MAG: bifunctional DNA primase/polymerase [Kiritimatiellae bacterium]|nr:bifunctional DNA primase/polymerase [Kiritimatiellia bacterium]